MKKTERTRIGYFFLKIGHFFQSGILSAQNLGPKIYHGSDLILIRRNNGDFTARGFIFVGNHILYNVFFPFFLLFNYTGLLQRFHKKFGGTIHNWWFRGIELNYDIVDIQTH